MKTKFFTKNEKGKIEFTETELKVLLDEIYNEGYNDGRSRNYIYETPILTTPLWQYKWYEWGPTNTGVTRTATTGDSSTITIKGDTNETY